VTPLDRRLLTKFWHLVAHRRDLDEPGDYLRFEWGLGELVLFNDQGTVIAFDNICPHRGARFFTEDSGTGRVICPYHGWSYRSGAVRVPLATTFGSEQLNGLDLKHYQISWCGDFLFVAVTPEQTLAEQLAASTDLLREVSLGIENCNDSYRIAFKSNWRVAVENALEGYHVGSVHPQTLAPLGLMDDRTDWFGLNVSYKAKITNERVLKGLEAMGRFFDPSNAYRGYWTVYLFPFAMISSTFGYSYAVQNYWPSKMPNRSHFSTRLMGRKVRAGYKGAVESFFQSSAAINRQIFDEDHAICARVSPDYDLNAGTRIFAPREERVAWLHSILAQQARLTTGPD
jgi:phenylpropionate dioxygenase-like ring-hydroxylating dioxygenase large terminal subunit